MRKLKRSSPHTSLADKPTWLQELFAGASAPSTAPASPAMPAPAAPSAQWRLVGVVFLHIDTLCTCGASFASPNRTLMLHWKHSGSQGEKFEACSTSEGKKWLRAGVGLEERREVEHVDLCGACISLFSRFTSGQQEFKLN